MSNKFNESWSQQEKIELLVNVLQVQHQHQDFISFLAHSVRQSPLPFPWNEVPLPEGRSLRSCQAVFDNLLGTPRPQQPLAQTGPQAASPFPGAPQPRLYTSFEAEQQPWIQQTHPRAIQPRPSRSTDSPNPASTNGESLTIMRTSGPDLGGEKHRKKRGRPTKEEAEERDRQLAAEGRVYEPKKRPTKKFRASTGTPVPISESRFPLSPAAQATPLPQTVEAKDESSSGKRRSKRQASLTQGEPSSPTSRMADAKEEKAAESPSDRLFARFGERERAAQYPTASTAGSSTQGIKPPET